MATQPQTLISWQAPEFRHYPKNFGWYVTFIAIAILLVAYQVLLKDWFGAISLAIIAVFLFGFARQRPKTITISITDKGVNYGGLLIPYHHLRHFWIVDNPNHKTLNLETTAYLNKMQIIELVDTDPEAVRETLLPFLAELPTTEETFAQRVMHRFKF